MRFLKSFFLMVLASAFLVACGGGARIRVRAVAAAMLTQI